MANTDNSNQWLREIGQNDYYWADHLETVPNMICIAYKNLRTLARDGKVYGTMLQCKDVFELICKTPLIMALILLENDQQYKDTEVYLDIIRICLDSPMSMGSWNALAGIIVKKQSELHLPDAIYRILKKTRKLYQEKISDTASNVVNWRNNTIGHGVLKFEDDDSYRQELTCLLNLLKEYFDGEKKYSISGLYDNLQFTLGENKLIGDYWSDEIEAGNVQLALDGKKTEIRNYMINQNYKYYLFDAFYKSKKIAKYSSYIDGHSIVSANSYFSELSNRVKMEKITQKSVSSVYVKRNEERILEFLNAPIEYVEPKWLLEEIEQKMMTLGKGVLSIFMERGTGKSAFANQMNGLYYSPLMPSTFSRCYHIQNAVIRGVSDFTNSINFSFRHSSNTDDDLFGSNEELPMLSLNDKNPQERLAYFLNTYHYIYEDDYTMLILDGIDELTPETSDILKYLPTKELLEEGVFIVLLSRFEDESSVLGKSKEYIRQAVCIADETIEIKRDSKVNIELLAEYIKHNNRDIQLDKIEALISRADHRFLYLKAILSVGDMFDLDNASETRFIESFMNYISSFYGINQRTKIEEIAVTIALLPGISLSDYKKYITCQEISYEFVGLFNNLLPLMTATHRDGVTCYEFADQAYNEFIITRYSEAVQSVIDHFYVSFAEGLDVYLTDDGYRDFEKDSDFCSADLNNDIAFFAMALIELWGKAPRQCMAADVKVPEKHVLKLYTNLVWDNWAKFGIGAYLRDALRDCICMNLYIALLTMTVSEDAVCDKWANHIIDHIECSGDYPGKSGFYPYSLIEGSLVDTEKFDLYLLDYVVNHIKDIRNIKKWYWVFIQKCSTRIAGAIFRDANIYDFVDYLLESAAPIYYEEWFELLLTYDIPDEVKVRMTTELENPSYGEKLDYELYMEALTKSIALFEDYSTAIKDDMGDYDEDNDGPIYTIFHKISGGYKISELLGKENVQKLYTAFINRLNHEFAEGTFEDFICELYHFDSHLLSKIYEQYYGEEWPEQMMVIIPDLIRIEGGEHNFATDLLVDLITKLANWLENKKRFAEEMDFLVKLIDGIDGRHFLTWYTYPINRNLLWDSDEWDVVTKWYPTDNALYLLILLNKLDLGTHLPALMDVMEMSYFAVDKTIYKDEELSVAHELQVYRFLQVRKALGYHTSFDDQITALAYKHREYVFQELNNISSRSSFSQINHQTELWLDYAWQLMEWSMGIEECENIINLISEIESQDNSAVVAQNISSLKDMIIRCKTLFMFMNGNVENDETDNLKSEVVCSYDYPRFTLIWCLNRIFDDEDATESEKMDKILGEVQVKLRYL